MAKEDLKNVKIKYVWEDEEYSNLLIKIAYMLRPWYKKKGMFVVREANSVEIMAFIMKGNYDIGFYNLIETIKEGPDKGKPIPDSPHWHKL